MRFTVHLDDDTAVSWDEGVWDPPEMVGLVWARLQPDQPDLGWTPTGPFVSPSLTYGPTVLMVLESRLVGQVARVDLSDDWPSPPTIDLDAPLDRIY